MWPKYQAASIRGKHKAQTFCWFLVQALITVKETVLHKEACEPAVMPDFMMSGNSYLLPKENSISNPTKNSSILC